MSVAISRASVLLVLATAACAPGPRDGDRTPAPERRALPPIERVEAPLTVDVVYPREGASIAVRDSTFIFGHVGTGGAALTINGASVPVQPNGAFIGFLPVPADGVYRLEATKNGQTASGTRNVKVPAGAGGGAAPGVLIQAGSITPSGGIAVGSGEQLSVSFRGTAGGRAAVVLPDGRRIALVEERSGTAAPNQFVVTPEGQARTGGVATYRGVLPAIPLRARDTAVARPSLGPGTTVQTARENLAAAAAAGQNVRPAATDGGAMLELVVGSDTVRTPLPLNLTVLSETTPRIGVAADPQPAGGTNDGYVVGRPAPGTTSNWFWPNGTEFLITGERSGEYRVKLGPDLTAWVQANEVRLLPAGTPEPASLVGSVRLHPDTNAIDVRFNLSRKLPFEIRADGRTLDITIYGATSATDWLFYGPTDPLVETLDWTQVSTGVYRLRMQLSKPVWGWEPSWAANNDLVVRVRRPPAIDPQQPLRGLFVAIDPGHGPPEGRFGPTRYTEAAANLAIGLELRELLQRAGARVLMTRTDSSAVGLYDRPMMAKEAGAHVFVSIHNNALPDGVNPFVNSGTSVYYFHSNSAKLATALQSEVVQEFGLKDLGAGRSSLAVVRWSAWFPSALTESMFFMIPEQEAALKNPGVQRRIAETHLRAIETFVREQLR